MNQIVLYKDLKPGTVFRVVKGEYRGQRFIRNDGIYVKIADSHAWDRGKQKDAIFSPDTPCRPVGK